MFEHKSIRSYYVYCVETQGIRSIRAKSKHEAMIKAFRRDFQDGLFREGEEVLYYCDGWTQIHSAEVQVSTISFAGERPKYPEHECKSQNGSCPTCDEWIKSVKQHEEEVRIKNALEDKEYKYKDQLERAVEEAFSELSSD